MNREYILMTGAPGSKWSSVNSDIYNSPDINNSDYDSKKTYHRTSHEGTYFDPGMEYDIGIENWDKPFTKDDFRSKIIKSHTFAYYLDYLKDLGYPIVLVYRGNEECMDWWLKAGGFNITYPDYNKFYVNEDIMRCHIKSQNANILHFLKRREDHITEVFTSDHLNETLGLTINSDNRVYSDHDIKVYVYEKHS